MLKCNEIADSASDYLDGNLGWREAFSVKMHIFMCTHCRRFVRHLMATIHAARNLGRAKAAPGDVRRIVDCCILPKDQQ